jgi:hypothetical protein
MKKIFLLAVAAVMATMSVSGQDAYADMKHEMAITSGGLSLSQFIDLGMLAIDLGQQDNVMYSLNGHAYTVEYFYRLKKWLGVGGMLMYGNGKPKAEVNNALVAEAKNHYLSLMPAVKLDWVRRQYFGMYSKLAVGLTSRHQSMKGAGESRFEETNYLHPNAHLTVVGMDFGSPHFRGFIDLGFGEQGIFSLGLRYKF